MNNGFKDKIAYNDILQEMYEHQLSKGEYLEPTLLVEELCYIINSLELQNEVLDLSGLQIFKNKTEVPLKQLFALYGINKISTLANSK